MNYIEYTGLLTAGRTFCYSAKVFSTVNAKIKVMQEILKRAGGGRICHPKIRHFDIFISLN